MKSEKANLFCRCCNPFFCFRMIGFLSRLVWRKVNREIKDAKNNYPPKVKAVVRQYQSLVINYLSPISAHDAAVAPVMDKIKLAVSHLTHQGEPNWRQTWPDDEQTESLHRWHWLISELTDNPAAVGFAAGVQMMRSWLASMGAVPSGLPGAAYTVSERIVNACLFADWFRQKEQANIVLPEDIQSALGQMADYLVAHLEYHDPPTTCNHIINNARALCFIGRELARPAALAVADRILQCDLNRLMTTDGFLNNGSSHYHFIFARWIVQIAAILKPYPYLGSCSLAQMASEKLLQRCEFFTVRTAAGRPAMPLFGDISPDCSPDWLLAQPEFASLKTEKNQGFQSFANSHWYRFDKNDFTVIWHAEPALLRDQGAHSHNDLCAGVAYYKGKPILLDPGRIDYQNEASIMAAAHNSLTVDNMDPVIIRQYSHFPFFYREAEVSATGRENQGDFIFTIKHHGWRRIGNDKITHERQFVVGHDGLIVSDRLTGRGRHTLKTFFHTNADGNIDLKREADSPEQRVTINGWQCPAYGEKKPAVTIVFTDQVRLPFSTKYIIRIAH